MEYAETFKHELSLLKERVIVSIEANLKRIGKTHEFEDDDSFEFFNLTAVEESEITGINANGTLINEEGEIVDTVRGFIHDDKIQLNEAIYLLEDLEQI